MDRRKIRNVMFAALAGICAVLLVILGIAVRLHAFNTAQRVQPLGEAGEYLKAEPVVGDGWVKEMPPDFVYPPQFSEESFSAVNEKGIPVSYGRTVEFNIANLSDIEVSSWELVLTIPEDLYVNKAWNGEVEFSQFGGEKTDRFNTMQAVHGATGVDSAVLYELTVFPAAKGDQIIYYPSAEYGEYPIAGIRQGEAEHAAAPAGIIFYTTGEELDLSGGFVRYYLHKTMAQSPVFWVMAAFLMAFAAVLLVCLIVLIVGKRYERVQREANEKAERALNDALEAVAAANREKTVFLSNMSRDVREPVHAVIHLAEEALAENPDQKVRECLEKISGNSARLLTLADDLGGMGPAHEEAAQGDLQPMDLTVFNETVVDMARGFLEGRQVELLVSCQKPEYPYVLADEAQLRRILGNVLRNAAGFAGDGERIAFAMDSRPGEDGQHMVVRYRISHRGTVVTVEIPLELTDVSRVHAED